jgi:serine/threonine protein kinase
VFDVLISGAAVFLAAISILVLQIERRAIRRVRLVQREQRSSYQLVTSWYRSQDLIKESPEFIQLLTELDSSAKYLTNLTPLSLTRSRLVGRAIDKRSGQAVTLKTLIGKGVGSAPDARGLFNEAFILSLLGGTRSPKLISAFSTETGRAVVLREFQDGVSLDRILIRNSTLDKRPRYSEVKDLLESTSSAISEIHSLGIVHGDLKPANLVANWRPLADGAPSISPESDVTLLDFESAVVLDPVGVAESRSFRGTAFFMAPERYASSLIGRSADVYSISALASLLLTGRPVRPGQSAGARIASQPLRDALRKGFSVFIDERQSSIEDWINDVIPAITALIERDGDQFVDWPVSMTEFAREVTYQTATVDTSTKITSNYQQVIESLLLMSLELSARNTDAIVRSSAELISAFYNDAIDMRQLYAKGSITPDRLRKRIQDAVLVLDENNRHRAHVENEALELKMLNDEPNSPSD